MTIIKLSTIEYINVINTNKEKKHLYISMKVLFLVYIPNLFGPLKAAR